MSPRTIKFIPCYEVREPGTDEMAIMDADLDLNHASKGYLGYEGVVYRPPWNSQCPISFPDLREEDYPHALSVVVMSWATCR